MTIRYILPLFLVVLTALLLPDYGFGGGDRGGPGGASSTPTRGQLNNFPGMPSDEGMPHSGAAAGAATSNRNQPNHSGAQGAAAGAAASNRNQPNYSGGQGAGTTAEYYQGAVDLAATGTAAEDPADGDWLPLEVFAFSKAGTSTSDVNIQLAVNKQGVLRGNYTDTVTNQTQLVQGSVDKNTQRAAFTVGNNTKNVVETGLYNLTKDEAPALIHFGQDRTEQWQLTRLSQDDKPGAGQEQRSTEEIRGVDNYQLAD